MPLWDSQIKVSSDEPLQERQVGVMEDRASGDSELVVALFAVQQFSGEAGGFASFAAWALETERPAEAFQ